VILFDAFGDACPRAANRDAHQERGQHHEQDAQAVHTDIVRDAKLRNPRDALDELHFGRCAKRREQREADYEIGDGRH
jgi:hypothetical protein